jgi:hypothetical protein
MKSQSHILQQSQPARHLPLREVTPSAARVGYSSPAEESMKCVWSGYPASERDCRLCIPGSVVVEAWRRERELKDTVEGFFYFSWRNGVWLAYGVKDGGMRGVYCPTHCSERDARETTQGEAQGGT